MSKVTAQEVLLKYCPRGWQYLRGDELASALNCVCRLELSLSFAKFNCN